MASRAARENPPGLILGDRIGKGSFATVYKGQIASDGSVVAIKIVQRAHLKRDKRLLDNFEAEMAILKRMKHPHVVSLLEVVQTLADFNLVMEYCSLGDLSRFIRKRGSLSRTQPLIRDMFGKFPCPNGLGLHETVVRHFLCQLASALRFLREHDLIHRDIKPQNLLLRPPPSPSEWATAGYVGRQDLPVLKLADFGFARFLPAASMAETLCGSPLYMAPEILHYEKYNAKADLWSVGAVAFEMATGNAPFPAANHIELIKKIDDARDVIPFPPRLVGPVRDVISRLLLRSPANRMSFAEFFAHSAVHDSTTVQPPERAPTPPELPSESAIESSTELEERVRPAALTSSHDGSESNDSTDYVVIEKRTVEVNALADRMQEPKMAQNVTPRIRRLSSIAYGASPTTALAQALLKSSARLFGGKPAAPPVEFGVVQVRAYQEELEQLATIGKVVSLYADVKYGQLTPGDAEVAAEALALYLKALSVLATAMDRAAQWWDPGLTGSIKPATSISTLIQWIRVKFNECVERADAVRPQAGSLIASAEKLLFERAVEMARAAAVQELNGDTTSETNYGTAVWMLRALVVSDGDELNADDRAMVEKLMGKIAQRVAGLKRSLEVTPARTALTPP